MFEKGYTGGDGTSSSPFQISTIADWFVLSYDPRNWDKHFILINDIDFGGVVLPVVAPNTKTESSFHGARFHGFFDGNGKSLRNVTVSGQGAYTALFGGLGTNGEIQNLRVENIAVSGTDYVGTLCGSNEWGTIRACEISGKVTGWSQLGGLCGINFGFIIDSSVVGEVSGKEIVGNLCGVNYGLINGCMANGDLNGLYNSHYAGGLCGINESEGIISFSSAMGSVICKESSYYLGGLCGTNEGNINNCISTCFVKGDSSSNYLGGLCGISKGTITQCHATGEVLSYTAKYIGGLCGSNEGGVIQFSSATGHVHGGGYNSAVVGGLCGQNINQSEIIGCFARGIVSGTVSVGGLCGYNLTSTIRNSYAVSRIYGIYDESISGFVGANTNGKIIHCYSVTDPIAGDSPRGFCGQIVAGETYEDTGNIWNTQTSQTTVKRNGGRYDNGPNDEPVRL